MQPETRIEVPPFAEQPDGDDVIISNAARSVFLAVPREAVTLLHLLAEGHTVAEASAAYQRQYGAQPDIDDFVATLAAEGFLAAPRAEAAEGSLAAPRAELAAGERRYHFTNLPAWLARRVCSWPVLAVAAALCALALLACVLDPAVIPTPRALVFERDQLALALLVIGLSLVTVFVHEFAHLLGARAAGAPSRMGVGNRLWIVVAETDMTGVWLAPRWQRCVAFLAGPIFDLTLSAALVLVLFAQHRGWIGLDPALVLLVRATLFVGLARLLWQFYLFLPTDLYYVLATLCRCKNLMGDTQGYLLNQLARLARRTPPVDQSAVPPREMRVVRVFALVWIAGRALAFGALVFITLPVLAGYGAMLGQGLTGDARALQVVLAGPGLPIVAVGLQAVGILMWLRGMLRARGRYA